jgi:beta-lactamase regulating signal transducer with metallopeptidase domain
MTVDLLLELIWKSALCAATTLVLLRLLRRRSAAEKSVVAHLGLLALVLLPLGALAMPSIGLPAPESVSAFLADAAPSEALAATAAAPAATSAAAPLDWRTLAVAAWLLPSLALLVALIVALARLQLIRGRADVLVDPGWLAALARAQRRLGFKHGTALLTSGELASPVSWGVVRPIIIVDRAAAAQATRAEAIIAHELAHVARLDWLKLLAGRLAVALFWFNPLVWALARRSHQLCEEAADDSVLRAEIGSADYADLLLGAARHANRPALLAANGVAPSRSSLAQRVAHVLDGSRPRRAARAGWRAVSLVAVLGVNAALAAAEPMMRAPLERLASAEAGEEAAAQLDRIGSRHTRALALAIRRADWNARRVEGGTLFSEPAAVAPLVRALGDDRPEVRRIALWGLSEMRPTVGSMASAPVARLLADPAADVRGEAARALGDFGAVAQAEAISALLADPDPEVRRQAAHALGDLQSPASRAALQRATRDPDSSVRAKAAWALRQVGEAEAILDRYGGG